MEKPDALQGVFDELKLEGEAMLRVRQIVASLEQFELVGKAKLQTPAQQLKQLAELAARAEAVVAAIGSLDIRQRLTVDFALRGLAPLPVSLLSPSNAAAAVDGCAVQELDPWINQAQRTVLDLANAAKRAASILEIANGSQGRKKVAFIYAGYVALIADAVSVNGIKPGRGGQFERLCAAAFDAARVHSKPEGAIKYLTKMIAPEWGIGGYGEQ